MPRTSWHLDRRTFLRGAGLSLALPWLEAMSHASSPVERPKRFCAFFFGNGVALPGRNQAHFQDWHWFPHNDGPDYKLNRSLEPLEYPLVILGCDSDPVIFHIEYGASVASIEPAARRPQHRRHLAFRG